MKYFLVIFVFLTCCTEPVQEEREKPNGLQEIQEWADSQTREFEQVVKRNKHEKDSVYQIKTWRLGETETVTDDNRHLIEENDSLKRMIHAGKKVYIYDTIRRKKRVVFYDTIVRKRYVTVTDTIRDTFSMKEYRKHKRGQWQQLD